MIEAAKQRLQKGVPYLRHAIENAKKETGVVKLAIVSKNPDGSGKIFCEFEFEDFIKDICIVAGIGEQTEKQSLAARAREFLDTHGLTIKANQ
jgi:hypothetical protein